MMVYRGPEAYALADWRRQINDIYAQLRAIEDPWHAWRYWHDARTELFRLHPMSPLTTSQRKEIKQIPVFPFDPDLRFEVGMAPIAKTTEVADLGSDGTLNYSAIAKTVGLEKQLGAELTIYWIEGYGGGIFIPFKDATNNFETYGGGRYVADAIKGADLGLGPNGGLILDFNFAYSPSCALNNAYVCPLSPEANTLPKSIFAGEQVFKKPAAEMNKSVAGMIAR